MNRKIHQEKKVTPIPGSTKNNQIKTNNKIKQKKKNLTLGTVRLISPQQIFFSPQRIFIIQLVNLHQKICG
jgi:hypothetical protein